MKKGFTLIELLIVVIIIGILATLAMPQYQKLIEKARAIEGVQMMGHIRSGQWLYYAEFGKFYTTTGAAVTTDLDSALGIKVTEHFFENFEAQALPAAGANEGQEGVEIWCKKKTAPFLGYAFGMDEDGNILRPSDSTVSGVPNGSPGDYKTASGL